MRWIRSKLVVCVSLFLVLFGFGLFIISLENNVSAIEDYSIFTTTFTNDSNVNICYVGMSENCQGYKYLKITDITPDSISSVTLRYLVPDGEIRNTYTINGSIPFLIMPYGYRQVTVSKPSGSFSMKISFYNVPPVEGSSPSGSISITENGEYDVSSYATAVVDVPDTIIYGDYHDDLVKIYNAIIICAGVALVIYFFYCIYRMIIKTLGGY